MELLCGALTLPQEQEAADKSAISWQCSRGRAGVPFAPETSYQRQLFMLI